MQLRQKLYELVKREMQRLGRWKLEDRGHLYIEVSDLLAPVTIDEPWNNKQLQQAPAMTDAQSIRIDAIFHSIDLSQTLPHDVGDGENRYPARARVVR
jgi:hypothetical protein